MSQPYHATGDSAANAQKAIEGLRLKLGRKARPAGRRYEKIQSSAGLRAAEKGVVLALGRCECCGKTDIPLNNIVTIDSGQQLCTDCLKELRQAG